MAKSKAQTLTLLQELTRFLDDHRTFFGGTWTTTFNLVATAIAAGDDEEEDEAQVAALNTVKNQATSLYNSVVDLFRTVHPTLGRYASSSDLTDPSINLAAFHDKLIADSEAVKSRGLSKFTSMSAGGSNVGDGVVLVLNTNTQGTSIDISHIETLTLRCKKDATQGGVNEGNEEFEVFGAAVADLPWEQGGSGRGDSYQQPYGDAINDFSSQQSTLVTDGRIRAVSGTRDNLISNGGFESALNGSGTDKILPYTISSGDANVTLTSTAADVLKGDQSLDITGNFTMAQPLTVGQLKTLQAYGIHALIEVESAVTAATLTIKVKDGSSTYGTLSIDTTTLTDDTPTVLTPSAFILPKTIDLETLELEIQVTGYSGSGSIFLDEVKVGNLRIVDGGRAIGIFAGLTEFTINDTFTGATTSADSGLIQRDIEEAFASQGERGWLHHAGTAVFWTDPS